MADRPALLCSSIRLSAFTLLELLLAVSIFAVVLAAINSVFYGAMRLRNATSRAIEEKLPLQQVLEMLKRDLQSLVSPGEVLAGPLQNGTAGSTGSVLPPGAAIFYTCNSMLDETLPWGDVQKVAYYLKNPERANSPGRDLVRAVSHNLLPAVQEQYSEQWLMDGVERLQFAYYDGTAWRDAWDSTAPDLATGKTNNLPRAIKVEIDFAVDRGDPRIKAPAQIVVPVIVQPRTNQNQAATSQQ